jgi:hypothetical protein
MDQATIGGVIIAITEALKRTFPQISGTITIIVAGILGLVAGLAGLAGLDWVSGLILGLASAGVVKVAGSIGGK